MAPGCKHDVIFWRLVRCSLLFGLSMQPFIRLLAMMGSARRGPNLACRLEREVSVGCELVSAWPSSALDQRGSGRKHLPLRQGSGAAFLVSGSVDEMAFQSKVVVDAGVNRGELLQGLHSPEPQHRPLSSSEWQV